MMLIFHFRRRLPLFSPPIFAAIIFAFSDFHYAILRRLTFARLSIFLPSPPTAQAPYVLQTAGRQPQAYGRLRRAAFARRCALRTRRSVSTRANAPPAICHRGADADYAEMLREASRMSYVSAAATGRRRQQRRGRAMKARRAAVATAWRRMLMPAASAEVRRHAAGDGGRYYGRHAHKRRYAVRKMACQASARAARNTKRRR